MVSEVLSTGSLTKDYKGSKALQNVSVELRSGRIYGLIGKNGAGKSTLMRMVAGLGFPTSGTVALFGKNGVKNLQIERQRLGCMTERPSITPSLTAKENLSFHRLMKGMPDKDSVTKLLELVGLAGTGKKKAKDFSLGMKQRLGIAIDLLDSSLTSIGFLFIDLNVISILGAVVASIMICSEFDNQTIHDPIVTGHSRGSVVISKSLVFFSAVGLILLPYVIFTGIAVIIGGDFFIGTETGGFFNILTQHSSGLATGAEFGKLLAVMSTLLLVFMSQLSICLPLAFGLKRSVLVVSLYYAFSLVVGQLAALQGTFPLVETILSFTPFDGTRLALTIHSSTGDLLSTIVICVFFTIVMIGTAFLIFRKAEIE